MKSNSIIKVTAVVLTFSLVFSLCFGFSATAGAAHNSLDAEVVSGFAVNIQNGCNMESLILYDNRSLAQGVTAEAEDAETVTEEKSDNTDSEGKKIESQTITTTKNVTDNVEKAKSEKAQVTGNKNEEVKKSKYERTGISVADPFVNVRDKANTESKILGKLYKGCAAQIVADKDGWVRIKSGSVEGYIKKEFLAIGFDAEELVDKWAEKYATIGTTTLNVRESKNENGTILTQIPEGETYHVIKEYDEWVKISIDDGDIEGYVSKEYVKIATKFKEAVSVEEEQKAEEEKAEKERIQKEEMERVETANKSSSQKSSDNDNEDGSKSVKQNTTKTSTENIIKKSSSSGTSGAEVARYALNFVGNPYRYGGTSLTNGTDCSGFTGSIYASFGYHLGRSSRDQYASAGIEVSMSSIQAGDLLFYTSSSGTVNHVALYIGNGQVVHASNPSDGIKVSSYNYRTPCKARRVIY